MKVIVELELGQDAMRSPFDVGEALASAGSQVALLGELDARAGGTVLDRNGNTVGTWKVTE